MAIVDDTPKKDIEIQRLEDLFEDIKVEYFEDLRTPLLNPYMRPRDICEALGYKDTWHQVRDVFDRAPHIPSEHIHRFPKGVIPLKENEDEEFIEVLDREGIYHFIDECNKPKAKRFREWLVHKQTERENYILILQDDREKTLEERQHILLTMLEHNKRMITHTRQIKTLRAQQNKMLVVQEQEIEKRKELEEKFEEYSLLTDEQVAIIREKIHSLKNKGTKHGFSISVWKLLHQYCKMSALKDTPRKKWDCVIQILTFCENEPKETIEQEYNCKVYSCGKVKSLEEEEAS